MATFKVPEAFTFAAEAGADLTTSLNRLVKMGGDGLLTVGVSGDKVLGPIIEVPLAVAVPYGPATVQIGGIAKMVASAAIARGTRVNCAASGKIQAGTTNAVGVTLEAASADGTVVAVAMIF